MENIDSKSSFVRSEKNDEEVNQLFADQDFPSFVVARIKSLFNLLIMTSKVIFLLLMGEWFCRGIHSGQRVEEIGKKSNLEEKCQE